MTYKAIRFSADNKSAMDKFLSLPRKLYRRDELVQDTAAEKALLTGTHTLSKYFEVYPILVLDENEDPAARCVITVYPDRECAYFGFFECVDDIFAVKALMSRAESLAAKLGRNSLVGPVDCSFWIRNRLKTNHLGTPYTGEPYNKYYYDSLLKACGYGVCGEYISNKCPAVPKGLKNELFGQKLAEFEKMGLTLEESTPKTFDRCLRDVYSLMIDLYSDFQTYTEITEEEFCQLFSPLKKVIDGSMVRMAYHEGRAVGFFVSVPDFGNAAGGDITPRKLMKIMKIKRKPRRYIMMYMGADPAYHGLGKAMSESIRQTLTENGAESVSALIRKGKVNSGYYAGLVQYRYEYKLYEKTL